MLAIGQDKWIRQEVRIRHVTGFCPQKVLKLPATRKEYFYLSPIGTLHTQVVPT